MAATRKVIITCAVTGSIHTPTMSKYLPITPKEIADAAIGAAEAGAAIVHLHARNVKDGSPTQDPNLFREFLPTIKAKSNVVINLTTGGAATMTTQERLQPALQLKPEVASLNMGSMNFGLYPMIDRYKNFQHQWEVDYLEGSRDRVFKNTYKDIEYILTSCSDNNTRFELECYDISHLYNLAHFVDRGLVKAPFFVQSVFGIMGSASMGRSRWWPRSTRYWTGSAGSSSRRSSSANSSWNGGSGSPWSPTTSGSGPTVRRRPARKAPRMSDAGGAVMVRVEDLYKTYRTSRVDVPALTGVSFTAGRGTLVAVRGRSASGKTTLLNMLGGLDRPDRGRVVIDGQDVTAMNAEQLGDLRRRVVGFVFQSFGLIPILSAAENVGVPMRLVGADPAQREERVRTLLDQVGLAGHARQRPGELSGGQQQRVAIARALANSPRLLIADEPTAQLDSQTGRGVMRLLVDLVHGEGVTAVVATHDPALTELADHVVELRDGRSLVGSVAGA